jgi:hypothetical protein
VIYVLDFSPVLIFIKKVVAVGESTETIKERNERAKIKAESMSKEDRYEAGLSAIDEGISKHRALTVRLRPIDLILKMNLYKTQRKIIQTHFNQLQYERDQVDGAIWRLFYLVLPEDVENRDEIEEKIIEENIQRWAYTEGVSDFLVEFNKADFEALSENDKFMALVNKKNLCGKEIASLKRWRKSASNNERIQIDKFIANLSNQFDELSGKIRNLELSSMKGVKKQWDEQSTQEKPE